MFFGPFPSFFIYLFILGQSLLWDEPEWKAARVLVWNGSENEPPPTCPGDKCHSWMASDG